jgi:hypothetical protein
VQQRPYPAGGEPTVAGHDQQFGTQRPGVHHAALSRLPSARQHRRKPRVRRAQSVRRLHRRPARRRPIWNGPTPPLREHQREERPTRVRSRGARVGLLHNRLRIKFILARDMGVQTA